MIVRVSKKQTRYSVVDNTGFEDERLSCRAKGVLGYFLTKPDNWEINLKDLKKHCTDGRDSILAGMNELRKLGYAALQINRNSDGKVAGKQWVIFEVPHLPKTGISGNRSATDSLKFRGSVKPGFGESGYIVNTESLDKGTDILECEDAHAEKKSVSSKKEKKSPPNSAAPPQELFIESRWASAPYTDWCNALLPAVTDLPAIDPSWYLNRVRSWSAEKGGKSADWVSTAARFAREDQAKQKLVTLQPIQNGNAPSDQQGQGTSTLIVADKILARADRILQRRGYAVGNQ